MKFDLLKTLSLLILLLTIFFFPQTVQAVRLEEITSFHSDIIINQDTSLTIAEEIHYSTAIEKHGIYRYIPIIYNQGGVRQQLPIRDISITDENGRSLEYSRSFENPFLTLKIGDSDTTFIGDKIYIITYTVDRGVRLFDDHAELFWDVTGEGWRIPIAKSSARIISDFALIERIDCFSGVVGGDDGLCQASVEQGTAFFEYDKTVNYGSNFTLLAGMSKESQLVFPTELDLLVLWIRYNWAILLVPIPFLIMFIWWNRFGRDIQFISPNVFSLEADQPTQLRPLSFSAREPLVYAPLKELTPGEAGALLDEKVDVQDILAEILDLARKKYIKITALETKQFFGTKREFEFKKLAESDEGLSGAQQLLFRGLFATGDIQTSASLKGSFYTTILAAKQELDASLVTKQVFVSNPNTARAKGMGILFLGLVTFRTSAG